MSSPVQSTFYHNWNLSFLKRKNVNPACKSIGEDWSVKISFVWRPREEIMKSRWSSFCLCLLDWDVLIHSQPQQVPYLHVITWDDSVTIVSSISVYSYDFTKLRMWLQVQHFQVVDRESWHITAECRTPHWTLPISFCHLAHTLARTYCRSPARFQIFFLSLQLIASLPCLSYLFHLQIVEGKSENLFASWGELLCPTKIWWIWYMVL